MLLKRSELGQFSLFHRELTRVNGWLLAPEERAFVIGRQAGNELVGDLGVGHVEVVLGADFVEHLFLDS